MGPGKDTQGTPVLLRRKSVGGPTNASRDVTKTARPRVQRHVVEHLNTNNSDELFFRKFRNWPLFLSITEFELDFSAHENEF